MSDQEPLSPEQILALVRTVFPDGEIISCRRFVGEHTNLNYDLRCANPTMELVLKAYTGPWANRAPWKETRLLRMLTSETGVPVPRVLRFDDSAVCIDRPWALHTRLPGCPLSQVVDTVDSPELESIGYEVGRYLGHIHRIPLSGYGELLPDAQAQATEKAYIVTRVTQLLESCATEALLPPELEQEIRDIYLQTGLLNRRQPCLLHGRYLTENIMVELGRTRYHVTGILEFEYASGGSPEQDMSELFMQSLEGLPPFQKGFLDGYAESGELVAQFWQRLRLYQILKCLEGIWSEHESGRAAQEQECRRGMARYLNLWSRGGLGEGTYVT